MNDSFDIAIVGGGMVGASLAVALKGLDVRVALIEAVPHDSASQPSFDERTTALSNGSRRILETLGVWPDVAAAATPIRKIHVSDQGHFGFARIDAAEQGLQALGYVVPNRALGSGALVAARGIATRCAVYCPAHVSQVSPGDQGGAARGHGGRRCSVLDQRRNWWSQPTALQSAVRERLRRRGRCARLRANGA